MERKAISLLREVLHCPGQSHILDSHPRKEVAFLKNFFGKQIKLRGAMRGGILRAMGTKVLVGVAVAAVVGLYWARPDLMVLLIIVIAVGVYGWRHPDLDDWRGH